MSPNVQKYALLALAATLYGVSFVIPDPAIAEGLRQAATFIAGVAGIRQPGQVKP